MAIDKKYLEDAKDMLSGGMENQKIQMQNSFNQNVQALEGQKAGVNQNFDNQLEQNTRNTTMAKNDYGNNSLARGVGRSTIATSGQAGLQDKGNRISNEVEGQRVAALSNIEAQKAQLQQALQNSLLGLEAQQNSESLNLARQLEEMAYNRDFQGQQFEFTKEQAVADRTFRDSQFTYQKAQDELNNALEREKFGYTKDLDKVKQNFAQAQFDFQKSQQAWDNAFKDKQFAFQKSSTGGSGGSSGGSSRSSGGSSGGGNYSESQMWSEFNKHLAADLKNGSYESGRFAEKIKSQNPNAAAKMTELYKEARNKRGDTPKQSVKSKTSNNSYQSR